MAWKKNKINMGKYNATEHELKAYRWCIRNKIYIAPKAINDAKWSIVITNNGRTYEDPSHYIKDLIWEWDEGTISPYDLVKKLKEITNYE